LSLLTECLESILCQTYRNYEVILVDNASVDGSVALVQHRYPLVKIVQLHENTGFTGGNIAGLRHASGEAIVLLNNDTVLTERWLEFMVEGLYSDPSIGLCSARIVIAGTGVIDSVGDTFTTAFSGTKMGEYEPLEHYAARRLVPGACAAAVIYRREMLEQIGFLDVDFFFNHEDTDLNLRAWLAGWKCLYVPEAVVLHKVNASVGILSDFGVYHFARNSVWVWLKNLPMSFLIRSLPARILYELSSFAYFCLIKGRWRPFMRGKCDALTGIPKMWRKRRAVLPLVRLAYRDVASELIPVRKYLLLRLRAAPR
jgi:hypothetical protein